MSFLRNIPQVTKNLLIINIVLYLVSIILFSQQINDLSQVLGAHYLNSPLFKPFQAITHMFMHSMHDPLHIFFNMFLLVMFGTHLERIWGAKRFFIFYMASGIGAFLLYNSIGVWQLMELKNQLTALGVEVDGIDNSIINGLTYIEGNFSNTQLEAIFKYYQLSTSTMAGASGAIFGILAGFAILFPNTELMLLFPPIPIKAKYLIGAYVIFEVYSSFNMPGDNIAHLAHVGGAIVGGIMVLIWRKRDRKNFW